MSATPDDPLPDNASPDLAALEAALGWHTPATAADPAASGALPPPAGTAPRLRPVMLTCDDGTQLAACWHEPTRPPEGLMPACEARRSPREAASPARAVAVIHCATGVPQRFYRHFAAWLAERGYAVLSYDYRGIGASRLGPMRADRSRMRDWALQDMSAALAEAERRRAGQRLPLLLIGHSFGGNALGLARGVERADALLTVGSQSGDWRMWPGRQRWLTWAYFHLMLPLVGHLFGRAPGWSLGGRGEGLPKQVALEWARWGRRRGYLFSDPSMAAHIAGYRRVAGTVHLWNISDDLTYGPASAVDALAAQYSGREVRRHELVPQALGLPGLGHFGAFRQAVGAVVWPRLLAPIEAATPALARALAKA